MQRPAFRFDRVQPFQGEKHPTVLWALSVVGRGQATGYEKRPVFKNTY
jgi:hypothetical protein